MHHNEFTITSLSLLILYMIDYFTAVLKLFNVLLSINNVVLPQFTAAYLDQRGHPWGSPDPLNHGLASH